VKLYNTLTRQVDELVPLDGNKVKIYNCGLTVYSHPHIGNWLGYIYWDVLVRTLRAEGYEVERTQNITDVGHLTSDDDNGEDKMEKGAKREGITAWDVAEKYIAIADAESAELGLTPPDHLVRATAMIDEQIAFAKILDEKGYLYRIDGDGMYFDTSKLSDYGKLARLDIEGLEAGARVSVEGKRNITDFAVWKFSPTGVKRDMEWDSPWGLGFPGWHLECSVIARETLGDQIDIHTGGVDHIPVHHTNEIAQTEAVTGKEFSRFWLHVNHIKSEGQKMSKSLGNIYTLEDIKAKGYDLDAFKVFALQKHYRTEGNFTWENLEAAQNRLNRWRETAALAHQAIPETPKVHGIISSDVTFHAMQALTTNDLDTGSALNVFDAAFDHYQSNGLYQDNHADFLKIIQLLANILGIDIAQKDISDDQKRLLSEREAARVSKDWAKSDALRDQLTAQGIGLRDTPKGAIWYRL
jgi:cysteinyl-tRNA synthetase